MTKRLDLTENLRQRIAAAVGIDVDPTKLVFFEGVVFNTRPLNKRGSIWNGAVADLSLLQEMAQVPSTTGGVPLHTLHMQGSEVPVGKVFYAEVVGNELRAQFYLQAGDPLVEKIDSAILDETSVGVRPKQLLCNKCGFDYMKPDAYMNIYDQTCDKEHTVGKDGTHVVLKGLDRWLELSLVSLGAADRPKIVGRTKALLGADTYNALAASGTNPEATTLFGSVTKDSKMTVDIDKLVAVSADLAVTKADLTRTTADVARLTAELATANETIKTMTANADKSKTDVQAALDATTAEVKKTAEFLTAQLKATNVALAKTVKDEDLPKDVPGLIAALSEATTSMHKLFPRGGLSASQQTGETSARDLSAFKLSRD